MKFKENKIPQRISSIMLLKKKGIFLRCISNYLSLPSLCRVLVIFVIVLAISCLMITYIVQQHTSILNLEAESSEEDALNDSEFMKFKQFVLLPDRQTLNESKFAEVKGFRLRMGRFDNEDARLVGFPLKNKWNLTIKDTSSRKIIYLATKYFHVWNPRHFYCPHLGQNTFVRYPCPINNCYVTNNPSEIPQSHAVLFHLRDLEVYSIPSYRTSNQIWILYSLEPSWLEIRDMRIFNGVFNWTMSYRRNSDVLIKYGFVGKTASKRLSKPKLNLFHSKTKHAVWYVSNCESESNREEYVARLRKVYPVDIIGGCGVEGCRLSETNKCYNEIESRYKFYLAFENAICRDYVTEKLFNALEYYIIPVTFGGVNYSDITPVNSIINALDFKSPEELGQYLWKVSRNEKLYLSYFAWKYSYRSYLQPWMCDLCEKLHHPGPSKVSHDLQSWWNEGNTCLRWSDGLKPIQEHAFPKYNIKL